MSKATPQDLLDLFQGHLSTGRVTHACYPNLAPDAKGTMTANIWGDYVQCRNCQVKIGRKQLVNATGVDGRSYDHLDLSDFEVQGISG